jgi:hypothetical protein
VACGSTARAVFDATTKFHHPAARSAWQRPAIDDAFAAVWELLRDGLLPRDSG